MIWRLDALTALAELLFGDTSLIYRGLDDLIFVYTKNRTLLRRKLCLQDLYIPKFLYTVNDRINQHLTQCCQYQTVKDTSWDYIFLSNIIIKIHFNEFTCFLHPNIEKIIKDLARKREFPDRKIPNSVTNDLNRKNQKQNDNMARIKYMKPEWKLKQTENWNQLLFRHKSKDAHILPSRSKVCLKFHAKGFWFYDYNFKDSHCQLVGSYLKKMDEYIRSLCQQLTLRQGLHSKQKVIKISFRCTNLNCEIFFVLLVVFCIN